MKNYRRKSLLNLFFVITFILLFVFFYLLNTVKLWPFNSYNTVLVDDNYIKVVVTLDDVLLFQDNNFFYYDNKKFLYKIESKEKLENEVILTLNLKNNFKIEGDDTTLLLPNIKKSIFSLIIDSWRSKWES